MKLLSILIFLTLSATSQVMWQVKTDTVIKWYLLDHDEFSDNQLNENKWNYGVPWSNFVVKQDLYFSKENVLQHDGIIDFVAKKETRKFKVADGEIDQKYLEKTGKKVIDNLYEVNYTAGLISSKQSYRYGYFEVRCKTNSERGIWPAFWLFGGNPNEEIDFFEGKGDRPNQMHLDVHCPDGCGNYKHGFLKLQKGWGAWVKINENFANKWNIISGEWQPGYIKFYLNGTPIAIMEREFKTFQQLYLNTSVAKDKEAFNPGPNETTNLPNSFLVDYVRVWSDKDTLGKMDDSYKLFENSINTVSDANLYEAEPKGKINYMYPKKMLNTDIGTITLLKVSHKKFSLSIVGKNLGALNVNVFDLKNKKVTSFILQNTEYSILDLSNIETGTYKLEILISNHVLSQEITILNP